MNFALMAGVVIVMWSAERAARWVVSDPELQGDRERLIWKYLAPVLVVGGVFVVAVMASPLLAALRQDAANVTPIGDDETALEKLMLDREAELPNVYTGELVDVDGDDTPDLALFGRPSAPILRPLRSEQDPWWRTAAGATIIAGVLGGVALVGKEFVPKRGAAKEGEAKE